MQMKIIVQCSTSILDQSSLINLVIIIENYSIMCTCKENKAKNNI